jgi:hypothetical protein
MNIVSIIENNSNTNLILNLLFALFINKNIIYNNFLENDNVPINIFYIQEIIKNIFDNNNNFKIVNYKNINYLKNIFLFNNPDIYKNNLIDIYNFLYDNFNITKIELINKDKCSLIENYNYINLNFADNNTDIKTLINLTLYSKILQNIPNFISFKLNRNKENIKIDIKKKITINSIYNCNEILSLNSNNSDHHKLVWKIHSIICYNKTNNYYYTIINNNDDWLLLLNNTLEIINIKLYENNIKEESVFVIYIYSN